MSKYEDYGVSLTKRDVVSITLLLGSAVTLWIAGVAYLVCKFLH
jgi:hypothetical protein